MIGAEERAAERAAEQPARAWASTRNLGRLLTLGLLVAGLAAAWIHRGTLDPLALKAAIGRYPAAPLIFLAAHVAVSLLFIPRTILAAAAGMIFGLWWGLLWASLGSVVGAIAGFALARYVNNGLLDLESMPWLGPALMRAERGGWRAVAMLRLIPILPHSIGNYALGLTRLPLGSYALGSFIGQLPMTFAYVDLGAAGERMFSGKASWVEPTLAGLAALAVSLLLPRLAARRWR